MSNRFSNWALIADCVVERIISYSNKEPGVGLGDILSEDPGGTRPGKLSGFNYWLPASLINTRFCKQN